MPTIQLTPTFDPTKAIHSRRQRFDFTPANGSLVKISCKMIDLESKLTTSVLKQPGLDDILRDVAEVAVENEETITLVDVEEIDTIMTALGGVNGLVQGTGILYVKDPRDATGQVKFTLSAAAGAAFACSIRRPDGAVRIGGVDWSKTSLLIRNLSGAKLVKTNAATAPDTVI